MKPPRDLHDPPPARKRSPWWPTSRWGTALLVFLLVLAWVGGVYTSGGYMNSFLNAGIWYLIVVGVRAMLPG